MEQHRDQELLLLLVIAKHCDPFGFCFPGRKELMRLRHCSKKKYDERLAFLVECGYVVVIESYDHRRRQIQFDFQVSPRKIYVRDDIQAYCEAIFDTVQERDFDMETRFLGNLFGTNDSQPEALPESETRNQKPVSKTSLITRNHNQLSASSSQEGRTASTMRNTQKQPKAAPPKAENQTDGQTRETTPQAVPPRDEFQELLSPAVDDDRIAQEIKLAVSTTIQQAQQAVATYPRDGIVHWLEHTARRRQRGELDKPGGYFFKMLQKHVPPIDEFGDLP